MINSWVLLTILISFLTVLVAMPYWIRKARINGLIGMDMHKVKKTEVVEGGGVIVLLGASFGILLYIAVNTFFFNETNGMLVSAFALLSMLFISSFVGIVDDLLGWKKGLSKRVRILIILFAAVPLMAVNAGVSKVSLPFFGALDLGLLYPLLIIPLGVVGATTTFNFVAGYNGLETRQGILILGSLAITTFLVGERWLSIIALIMISCLGAFYLFNKYPAKVFPGDVLTYSIGAMIAGIAILGNIEKAAVLIFTPYILEVFLKLRGKLQKESFAKVNKDGSLENRYDKIYSLTHLAIVALKKVKPSKKVYEKDVVNFINLLQVTVIVLVFLFALG